MSKPVSSPRFSLRSGAVLFSLLASLGACATIDTPRRGFATASAIEPAQLRSWGFATVEAPSQPMLYGYARMAEPVEPAVWGYARLPVQQTLVTEATK